MYTISWDPHEIGMGWRHAKAPVRAAALSPPARGPRYVADWTEPPEMMGTPLDRWRCRLLSNPAAHSHDAPTGLGDRSAFPLRVACTVVAAGMAAGRLAAHRCHLRLVAAEFGVRTSAIWTHAGLCATKQGGSAALEHPIRFHEDPQREWFLYGGWGVWRAVGRFGAVGERLGAVGGRKQRHRAPPAQTHYGHVADVAARRGTSATACCIGSCRPHPFQYTLRAGSAV